MKKIALPALILLGCGSTPSVATYTCAPGCPPGMTCAATGCVPDRAADLAVAAGDDMATAASCQPACSGSTPHCNADLQAWNDAKAAWRQLIRRFPDSHFVPEARLELAQLMQLH